ncbi:MAG TPA: hypothetical protein PLE10_07555 [Brevefilum sp.]|nr:hypothetical protein [Brevefilum sp.]HOR19662.1 hypothetical protein [Brevefilum sp.]HPL70074.1 hypothetical protein [Brevefilum sp.]
MFYITDLLQNLEAQVRLGLGADPRLSRSLDYVLRKQDSNGRWALDYAHSGKTWANFGQGKQPNK